MKRNLIAPRTVLAGAGLLLASCGGDASAPIGAETNDTGTPASSEAVTTPAAAPVAASTAKPTGSGISLIEAIEVPWGCRGNQTTIFACDAANGKRIEVCAAPQGPVIYRYGGSSPEIAVEAAGWASVAYSGGGEAQIAFDSGDTRYVVFSRVVRTNFTAGEPNNPAINDGVVVVRGDEFLAMQTCDDPRVKSVNVNALDALMDRRDQLFTEETGRADAAR